MMLFRQTSDINNGGIHNLTTQRFGMDIDIPDKDVIWDLHRTENKTSPANSEGLWVIVGQHGTEDGDMSTISMRNLIPYYGLTGAIKTPDGENGISDRPGLEIPLVEKTGRGVGRTRLTHYSQHGLWQINGEEDFDDFRHRTDNGNWITMESLVYDGD